MGDSVLGYKAHMGAGSITSNVKSDKKLVVVKTPEGNIETSSNVYNSLTVNSFILPVSLSYCFSSLLLIFYHIFCAVTSFFLRMPGS